MKEQRVRFMSNASTLASLSEPGSCYNELLKYFAHIICKGARQVAHICRFLARRAGFNIAASPPPVDPQRGQRRRRKTSRQGSVSVHHMMHHHQHHHHHHHHHYHLGNGSLRGGGSIRCLEGHDIEAGALNNNKGLLAADAGHLTLALPTSVTTAISESNLATLSIPTAGAADSSSIRSVFHLESLRCTPSPTNLGSTSGPFCLAPAPKPRAIKRNSVPFAAPGPKNYPTLQTQTLLESRRGSAAASTLTNFNFNLNIPPMPLGRRPSSLVDPNFPAGRMHSTCFRGIQWHICWRISCIYLSKLWWMKFTWKEIWQKS